MAERMNRQQRRRWSTLFRLSQIESIPRAQIQIDVLPEDSEGNRKLVYRPAGAKGVLCDWPGCQVEWQFSTHATVGKVRKVVARRCGEHRLTSAPT